MPLNINHNKNVNWMVDSVAPTKDLNSLVILSNFLNFNCSLLDLNLFFINRIFVYIRVGIRGKSKVNKAIFTNV